MLVGKRNMPIRVPMTPMLGQRVATTVGGRETRAPEKNLVSYNHQQAFSLIIIIDDEGAKA